MAGASRCARQVLSGSPTMPPESRRSTTGSESRSPRLRRSPGGTGQGAPTGIVANPSTTDFLLVGAGTAALFIWSTEDGTIAAWNGGPSATIKFNATDAAVYKGLALAGDGSAFHLYAADFHNGKIEVLDNTFTPTSVPGGFADPRIPAGFAPFNVMNLQGDLYGSYAKQQQGSNDEAHGVGLGIVDVFDADGFLIARVATRGKLNAPWGMAIAPAGFGRFGDDLLVGNFGDGKVNAYEGRTTKTTVSSARSSLSTEPEDRAPPRAAPPGCTGIA